MSARNFRDVADGLHHATLERHEIDIARRTFSLTASRKNSSGDQRLALVFEEVMLFKWQNPPGSPETARDSATILSVVGLERLAPDEPWRLYLCPQNGGELELACARIVCDGSDVSGIGRAYRS